MKFRTLRNRMLHRLGLERCYKPGPLVRSPDLLVGNLLEVTIGYCLQKAANFSFIQVGAFDGIHRDPLFNAVSQYNLHGVVVEPQKEAFERLSVNYSDCPNLKLVNAAVSETREPRTMFTIPGGTSAASFEKNHLTKHSIDESLIVEEQVSCVTFEDLISQCCDGRVDLIQIDAEGYDFEILKMIDFEKVQPRIVRYEQHHMTSRQQSEAIEMLAERDYRFVVDKMDVLALHKAA